MTDFTLDHNTPIVQEVHPKEFYLIYHQNGKQYSVSRRELVNIMCSTNECLDATFNMQIQTLVELLETLNRDIALEHLTDSEMLQYEEELAGVNKKTIEHAVKSYHQYAMSMFNI